MSVRRMNYTKRIDLKREHVRIRLSPKDSHGRQRFQAELDLPDGLPDDARVSLEAYRSSPPVRARFELGTVGRPRTLSDDERLLTDFAGDLPAPLFRLKVVGTGERQGRLLADARQVRPIDPEQKPDSKQGILHVHHKDLDGLVWELDFAYAGYEPTLWIDPEADPARDLAQDSRFVALVYPEVLRRVLHHLLIDEGAVCVDDEIAWGFAWYRLASTLPDMAGDECPINDDPIDDEPRLGWIDRAVRAFGKRFGITDLINPPEEEPA